jgi:hypothetical protein
MDIARLENGLRNTQEISSKWIDFSKQKIILTTVILERSCQGTGKFKHVFIFIFPVLL